MELCGKPMLNYVVETLSQSSSISKILIATSAEESDDPIASCAVELGVECLRGNLENVAARFLSALSAVGGDAAFRVNGDSPLVNRELFQKAADAYVCRECDLVTNVMPRTYPPGMSVELVNSQTYRATYDQFDSEDSFEHVTQFFYQNSGRFEIENIENESNCSAIQASVDTASDLERIRAVIRKMKRNHWEYSVDDVIELLRTVS